MSEGQIVLDGRLYKASEAMIPACDPAVLLGYSVFETLPVIAGRPVGLGEHLLRLEESARLVGLSCPVYECVTAEIVQLINAYGPDFRLRISLTGGGHRVLWARPLDLARVGRPVRVVTRGDTPSVGAIRGAKHGSRLDWLNARRQVNVDDIVLVDSGQMTEATTAGVIGCRAGVLWTAPFDGRILPSVTVRRVLAYANERGLSVVRRGPPVDSSWGAFYLCSSLRGLSPISELNGEACKLWDEVGRAVFNALWSDLH